MPNSQEITHILQSERLHNSFILIDLHWVISIKCFKYSEFFILSTLYISFITRKELWSEYRWLWIQSLL